ncbi:hypothetical protein N9S30_00595, partial [bacterium]|nr:hypothetical protein [bacterium]
MIENKYGPKYYVSKHEASVAFLSTQNFEDPNSISARMIQARFSNYGRFSCKAMKDFASDPTKAAAGSAAPEEARRNNPGVDYNSQFDRNIILIFATIFSESFGKETGVTPPEVNVIDFWQVQCEEPLNYRAPIPTEDWNRDRQRLGETDARGNAVEYRDVSPLVAFGSLRQIRDYATNGLDFPEDASDVSYRTQIDNGWYPSRITSKVVGKAGPSFGRQRRKLRQERKLGILDGMFQALGINTNPAVLTRSTFRIVKKDDVSEPHFAKDRDMREENGNLVHTMIRDTFCNPVHSLTVEDVVGDPSPFDASDTLYDSTVESRPKDMSAPGSLLGRGNTYKKETMASLGDSIDFTDTLSYRDRSLEQWVYITSGDEGQTVGFHRLGDLRVFPDLVCNEFVEQPCGYSRASASGSSTVWTSFLQTHTAFYNFGSFNFAGIFGRR